MQKPFGILACLLCAAVLSGCWNYRGLNEINIVTGVAIDRKEDGPYELTFEMVDTQSSGGDNAIKVKYVQAQGTTVFDALRNTKKKLINKLYGGNMQAIIISRQLAEREGVYPLLEEFLRDSEPRETLSVAISQAETARELLMTEGIDTQIISYEIHETIEDDNKVVASTRNLPLYKAYNACKSPGVSLVLPTLHRMRNGENQTTVTNGVALFREGLLNGFLDADQTMYYLYVLDEIEGGVFHFSFHPEDPQATISTEIKESRTKTSVEYRNGTLFVKLDIKTQLNLLELKSQLDYSQPQQRRQLEEFAAETLRTRILHLFREVQTDYGWDIFSLGSLLYKQSPETWLALREQWDDIFCSAQLQVNVQMDVFSTGVLKQY